MNVEYILQRSESLEKLITAIKDKYQCRFIPSDTDLTELSDILDKGIVKVPAAMIVMSNFTFEGRKRTIETRRKLIEKRQVKAVVQLPSGILGKTKAACTLLFLDKACESIRFADASNCITRRRMQYSLSDQNICQILDMLETDSAYSMSVPYKDIIPDSLSVYHYLKFDQPFAHGITLEDASKSIICGMQINPDELDAITTENDTKWRYVTPSNISNSAVDAVLPHFTEIKEAHLKHMISGTSLIIPTIRGTRMGLITSTDEQPIIAVGRLFVFELNTERVDPDEVLKFLASSLGQSAIRGCSSNAAISTLKLEMLKKIMIPAKSNRKDGSE